MRIQNYCGLKRVICIVSAVQFALSKVLSEFLYSEQMLFVLLWTKTLNYSCALQCIQTILQHGHIYTALCSASVHHCTATVRVNPRFLPRSPASLSVVVNVQQELYTCSRGLSSLLFSSDFKFRDMHTRVSLICKIFLRKEYVFVI